MTLVLSFARHGIAVQVADRLVSQQRGRAITPLDRVANKLLIYRARDAVASIGYAGQAFIGDLPTDEWIAQFISGEPNVRGPDDMGGFRIGRTPNNWNIGQAVRRIRDALPANIVAGQVIYICVVGQQINHRRIVRPFIYEMELQRNDVKSFYKSPRDWPRGWGHIGSIGVEIGNQERKRILKHLLDANPPLTHEQIAEFLTATIREHEQPGVGLHTTAVTIPIPGSAPVRSRFFPHTPHHVLLRNRDSYFRLETAYAPWIVGPDLIKAPTADIGGMTFQTGGVEVAIEGAPPPTRGILAGMSSMPRFALPPHLRR